MSAFGRFRRERVNLRITIESDTTYCFIYCTGVGANVILDCVGSSFVKQNLKSIGTDGRWVLYGLLGGGNVDGNILGALLKKRVSLLATTLRSRSIEVS